MTDADERTLAHARALRARGAALPPDGLPSAEILDSWVRCGRAGLDFAAPPPMQVVDTAELARRRDRLAPLRRFALAEIETLFQQIAGSDFLLALADRDGVILDLCADNRFKLSGGDAGIVAGSCWSEALCGTNGLGTALATGRSVAVNGLEHFFFKHADISCTAAPIREASGAIVGVLDASSYVQSRQRHTQALVQMAATHVENLLLAHQMRGHLVLAIHPRAEFIATLSCGLVAFDAEGRVSAANARAHGLLAGLPLVPGTPFERLFDAPFERFVARLHGQAELRLRDVLGSLLVASCVQAPPPAGRPAEARAAPALPARPHEPAARPTAWLPAPAMVAEDPAVAEVLRTGEAAMRLGAPVLICGATGTGKELLARHLHERSGRTGAFVAVNCAALPAELFEAELFGYVGGAFTGARREGSAGLIAGADGGTLLLDELAELPLPLQAGLLRFLDDRLVRPVGGTAARPVDVQILAASHADLAAEAAARRFRADLLHRLDTVTLRLPSLRERRDFGAVARHVLAAIDPTASLDEDALPLLARQPWPGNMRELRAVLTRALLACPQGRLARADFERQLAAAPAAPHGSALQQGALQRVLSEFERTGRSVSQTSRNLGVSRTTVYRYLRQGAP